MKGDPLTRVPTLLLSADERTTFVVYRDFESFAAKQNALRALVYDDRPYFAKRLPPLRWGMVAPLTRLRIMHESTLRRLRYQDEDEELLEAPSRVWNYGEGDCEDQAVVIASWAQALADEERARTGQPSGIAWSLLATGGTPDDPEHETCVVSPTAGLAPSWSMPIWVPTDYVLPDPWYWAETSEAARFGEHPYAAARRLGAAARTALGRGTAAAACCTKCAG